ncbi:MAG: hypothetical protein GTO41_14045 [Burkholderiales bacterium]|nr:hypothetical protein [Burkholderiales bacterium]
MAVLPAAWVSAADTTTKGQRESILLVAADHMLDPTFARTVVFVMFPTDAGPSGVILNRPSPIKLRDIWPADQTRQGRTDTLYFGGPVEPDGLLFLFRMAIPPLRAWWAIDDIYFSGDGELLEALLEESEPVPSQRFFAGYAGWAPGQLENEIGRGDWHVLPADPDVVFDNELDTLWLRMYQRATLPRAQVSPLQPGFALGLFVSRQNRLFPFYF